MRRGFFSSFFRSSIASETITTGKQRLIPKRWKLLSLAAGTTTAIAAGGFYQISFASESKQQQLTPTPVNLSALSHTGSENHIPLRSREDHIQKINSVEEYDVIIIGGGCNGAGVFLDATQRGLRCLLLESEDFAAATSSKSTKLIHGGVRYLQEVFEFSTAGLDSRKEKYHLVKEALRERTHFVENAFYMNRSIPFVVPTTNIFSGIYYYIGCLVYHGIYLMNIDSKHSSYRFQWPQWFGGRQLREFFPHLDEKFSFGIVYYDGQFNDARMNMDILLTGTCGGAQFDGKTAGEFLNYAKVNSLLKNESTGRTEGVVFEDKISKQSHSIKAKCVVNCTGSFADEIRKMDDATVHRRIMPVCGSHITMPKGFSSKKHALVIPETADGRILFLVPWLNNVIVGTTERSLVETELNPTVSHKEMLFMAKELGNLYPNVPSTAISDNIRSKWAGVRPLVLAEAKPGQPIDTKKVARNHVIEVSKNGLVSLLGGKWTIYRSMGEETVDVILKNFREQGISVNEDAAKKSTLNLRLLGEANRDAAYKFPPKKQYTKIYANALMSKFEIEEDIAKNLIKTYGVRAFDILQLAANERAKSEAEAQAKNKVKLTQLQEFQAQRQQKEQFLGRLHEKHPFIKAEILYHIRYEMAQQPIDVLFRRTRLGFLDRKAVFECLPTVCDIFANELKWDAKKKAEVLHSQREAMLAMDF